MNNSTFILMINELTYTYKILTDMDKAEEIENNENNNWMIETVETSRAKCLQYYNEFYK